MTMHSEATLDAVLSRQLEDERIIIDGVIQFDDDEGYIVVKSSSYDEEEEYELPLWIAMIGVFVLAICIAGVVFYLSYKHESICGKHADAKEENKEADEMMSQLEQGEAPEIPTKKFNDSEVPAIGMNGSFHTHDTCGDSVESEESSLGSGSDGSSQQHQSSTNGASVRSASTTNSRKSLAERVTEPRCVLCSVAYVEGEDVAISNNTNCHHEYHMECLLKHWTKTKATERNCPVCKERFNVETSC